MTKFSRKFGRHHRSQFDHGIPSSSAAASPHHHAVLAQFQVGGVEKNHLAEFGVQDIHLKRIDCRAVVSILYRQLQFDGIGVLDEFEHFCNVLVVRLSRQPFHETSTFPGLQVSANLYSIRQSTTVYSPPASSLSKEPQRFSYVLRAVRFQLQTAIVDDGHSSTGTVRWHGARYLSGVRVWIRFGRWRSREPDPEPQLPARMIIASVLSLLAFILGFTFALASSHFDSRNQALHDEATAIATAYHRADLLPEPERTQLRNLLREYVDLRLEISGSANPDEVIARLRRLQERIWARAIGPGKQGVVPTTPTLLLQSLNEMIDVQSERVLTNVRARIPGVIWAILYGIILISVAAAGYHSGLAGNLRRSFAALAYALVFAAVIVMIADADIPQFGQFRVNRQPLLDLRARFSGSGP